MTREAEGEDAEVENANGEVADNEDAICIRTAFKPRSASLCR